MVNEEPSTSQAREHLKRFRDRRDKLIALLELQSDIGAIHVDEMVDLYSHDYEHEYEYPQPVLALVQDIQTQMALYYNVFEDLKKGSVTEDSVKSLKDRYVALGLIPPDNVWPNPAADWLINRSLSKLRAFWRALTEIVARWRWKLTDELGLEPTMAVGFQLEFSVTPTFTITIQPQMAITRKA